MDETASKLKYTPENCEKLARYIVEGFDFKQLWGYAMNTIEDNLRHDKDYFDHEVHELEITEDDLL